MKIENSNTNVHILNSNSDIWNVIQEIANTEVQEDAFYVCDIGDIVRKHGIWKSKLPRVHPFYAVKCNDSSTVLEILSALGTGFDCASKGEINKILSMGVDPERIIFANPAKPASHIKHAAAEGVSTMTFDNEAELHKIKKLHPDGKLVIRIRCDALDAQCQLGMKFGCDVSSEAPHLLQVAKSLDLNVVGVSFHVGSGCREPAVFRRAIASSRIIFDLAENLGFRFNLLDIGGGYPGGRGSSIDEIAEIINTALDDFFPDPEVKIIAEPGRFYVSSAYTLACNIHSIRTTEIVENGKKKLHRMYFINDGVYGSFNCILYDHQVVHPKPLYERNGSKYYSSSIWGPTCDGLDQVVTEISLPDMKMGDWLVFEDMGAYTLPVASPFNGFPVPKVHNVAEENIWDLFKHVIPNENHYGMKEKNLCHMKSSFGIEMNDFTSLPISFQIPLTTGMIEEPIIDFMRPVQ